jgi:SAM-dependent methyltransferase
VSISFENLDRSKLPAVGVKEGYAAWAPLYDSMLTDTVDGPILSKFLSNLRISGDVGAAGKGGADQGGDHTPVLRIADLACGTGRNVRWLKDHGLDFVADGVDLSPEMLRIAAAKGLYRRLETADVADARLPAGAYDLALCVLASCHMRRLEPLYSTAFELLRPGGRFWLVDMHPCRFFAGRGTSFPLGDGRELRIENTVHLLRDHAAAARAAGLEFRDLEESLVPEPWALKAPTGTERIGHPLGFGFDWEKPAASSRRGRFSRRLGAGPVP